MEIILPDGTRYHGLVELDRPLGKPCVFASMKTHGCHLTLVFTAEDIKALTSVRDEKSG